MNVIKATHTKPDSDNQISFECEVQVENQTKSTIELIRTSSLLVNSKGVVLDGGQDDETEVYMEEGEKADFSLPIPYWVNANLFEKKNLKKVRVIVDALMFRRDFFNLGEINVPADDNAPAILEAGIKLGEKLKIYGASIMREKPEDGEVRVTTTIAIRNEGETHFEKAIVKVSLIDAHGAEIDQSEDYNSLPPKSARILTPAFWGVKTGKLKNCKVKLTLFVFQPVFAESTSFETSLIDN